MLKKIADCEAGNGCRLVVMISETGYVKNYYSTTGEPVKGTADPREHSAPKGRRKRKPITRGF